MTDHNGDGWERGRDHDGLLDDCAEEGHVFYPGDESALADSLDSYLTRTPPHPWDDDNDDGDTPPGDWKCEDCGAINSDLDAACQFCDPPPFEDDDGLGWNENVPRLWLDIAIERGAKEVGGTIDGSEFARVGVAIINGCPNCGATIAPYNSYQIAPDNPYAYCAQCAGVDDGS